MDTLTETVTRLDDGGTLRIDARGCEEWRDSRGQLHRDGGPALRHDGFEAWYVHGLRHRVDGPALRGPDGHEEWWVDGQRAHTCPPLLRAA